MAREEKHFVRGGYVGETPAYIAKQNRLVIDRMAFNNPEYVSFVKAAREFVEAVCQHRPGETLDRVVIELDYGVIKAPYAARREGER